MSWQTETLSSMAVDQQYSIVGGPFGSKLTARDYVNDGVPVIRGSNMNKGRFLATEDFVFVTSEKVRRDLFGNIAGPLDLIFTQRGTLGQVVIVPKDGPFEKYVVSQSQMKMTVDPIKADRLFIYYYFTSREAVHKIINLVSSSGVPHINLTVLRNFEIPFPPLPIQQKIATILSTYDDLIENNLRRIKLLEESARLLYREWFVNLRFPSHEHTRIVDGVPEGWEISTVGSLAQVTSGFAFKSKDWLSEGNPVIKIKNVGNNTVDTDNCQCVSDSVADKASKFLLKEGDLLIAMTGATVGKIGIMPRTTMNLYLNQRVGLFKSNIEKDPTALLFTFFNTREAQKQVVNYAAGAAQPNISSGQISSIKFLLPKRALLDTYLDTCQPFFEQRLTLIDQNQKLKTARDLLLPRLMNRELTV